MNRALCVAARIDVQRDAVDAPRRLDGRQHLVEVLHPVDGVAVVGISARGTLTVGSRERREGLGDDLIVGADGLDGVVDLAKE